MVTPCRPSRGSPRQVSRLYFTSRDDKAELMGWEFHALGGIVTHIALGVLGTDSLVSNRVTIEPLWRIVLNPPSYVRDQPDLALRTMFGGSGNEGTRIAIDGETVRPRDIAFNTCIAIGAKPLQLAARLAAQGEIHAWVDGPNRWWLADIIMQGREAGLYRPNSGWEDVAAMLLREADEPVVCSYSVSDSWPNPTFVMESGLWDPGISVDEDVDEAAEIRDNAWGLLSTTLQWDLGIEALRQYEYPLELRPSDWDTAFFGTGESKRYTVMDARRAAQEIEERMPGTMYGRIYTRHEVEKANA